MDYPNTVQLLTFIPEHGMIEYCECSCFTVNDDNVVENDEEFSIVVTSDDPSVVILDDCDTATVTIIDDDGMLC